MTSIATRTRLAGIMAAIVLVATVSAPLAAQPVVAGPLADDDGTTLADSVTENQGWLGSWQPSEDVVKHGADGYPGWVVEVESGHLDDLRSWANASRERDVLRTNNDSDRMVVAAPADHVLGSSPFSTSLEELAYVETIGVKREVEVDPITDSELRDQDAWSKPRGAFFATLGGTSGSFDADGAAWSSEVNQSTLADVRARIGADAVAANGSGVRVAVVDTGFEYDSETYGDRVPAAYNAISNESVTVNDSANATADDYEAVATSTDHGPWIATAIAGNGNGSNATGIAPGATLLPVKALGEDGSGTTSDIARGIEWAAEEGNADVISLSLGSPTPSEEIRAEITEALQEDDVSAVIVAAGNNRMTYRYVASPADSDATGVVTVAATDSKRINESESAYFSAVGPDPETGVSPDVAAPGMRIVATVPGNGNVSLSGTSMATPIVSGVAALAIDANSSLQGDPVAVAHELEDHAQPMPESGTTEVGNGRINASNAVQDVVPETSQETARNADATARDKANRGLSGSFWRSFSLSLAISTAPTAAVSGAR